MLTDTVEDISRADLTNLIPVVTAMLTRAGHPNPTAWESALHPDAHTVADVSVQRFLINRYWRMELSAYNQNTMDARFCLIDNGESIDWVRIFEAGVLPCIMTEVRSTKNV